MCSSDIIILTFFFHNFLKDKKPLFGYCKENEYYYPADQGTDYVCDCKPGWFAIAYANYFGFE